MLLLLTRVGDLGNLQHMAVANDMRLGVAVARPVCFRQGEIDDDGSDVTKGQLQLPKPEKKKRKEKIRKESCRGLPK
jgi:hypothetical protein